jgi:hypothetical protein
MLAYLLMFQLLSGAIIGGTTDSEAMHRMPGLR